jgi:small-conductance mechanosensitive channel
MVLGLGAPVGLAQEGMAAPTLSDPAPVEAMTPAPGAVIFNGETLFTLQDPGPTGDLTERAEGIADRVTAVAQDQAIPVEALALSETELGTAIYAEDRLIMVVSDADAAPTGQTRQALAAQYLDTLQAQIQRDRAERSAQYLSRAALLAVGCTLGLVLAILVLANAMPQFYRWLDRQQDRWVPNVRIQNFELLTAHQLTALVRNFTKLLHFALVLALILVYLSYVLSLFPATRTLGQNGFGYLVGALGIVWGGFVAYLPNLLSIVIILFLASTILRFAQWIFSNIRRERLTLPGFYPEWATPTFRLVQFLVVAFTLAVIFPYLPGSDSPAFQGVSIFFGLLVSLGAGGAIFSVVAGFILVYTRAFAEGDRIHFGDIEGFVEEKSLFVTRIRTIENVLVSVPNTSLLTSNIANYSALVREQQMPLILKTTITLGYDVPWPLVYETLIAAADATSYILKEPRPHVWQTSLDDFYVSYQLRAYSLHPDLLDATYSELHQILQDYCNQAGIEILSPHYGAMRDGNQSTIPARYLPDHYQPPAWNVPSGWPHSPGGKSSDGQPENGA